MVRLTDDAGQGTHAEELDNAIEDVDEETASLPPRRTAPTLQVGEGSTDAVTTCAAAQIEQEFGLSR